MLKPEEAQDRADALISQAKKAGADAADAIYVCDASTQVQMRLGNLEDVERSEGEEIGLRVFVGKRSATVSSSDMDPVILSALVGRAMDMAREAPEDQYAGLAPEELILKSQPDIMIDGDDGVTGVSVTCKELQHFLPRSKTGSDDPGHKASGTAQHTAQTAAASFIFICQMIHYI